MFASNNININSKARFNGDSIIATGNTNGNLNFNGVTSTVDANSKLRVISQGNLPLIHLAPLKVILPQPRTSLLMNALVLLVRFRQEVICVLMAELISKVSNDKSITGFSSIAFAFGLVEVPITPIKGS